MNDNILIPEELSDLIADRSRLWSDMDSSLNKAKELDKAGTEMGSGTAADVKPDRSFKTPMDEVAWSLNMLQTDLKAVEGYRHEIADARQKIQDIKNRARTRLILGVGAGIAVIIIIFMVISNQ